MKITVNYRYFSLRFCLIDARASDLVTGFASAGAPFIDPVISDFELDLISGWSRRSFAPPVGVRRIWLDFWPRTFVFFMVKSGLLSIVIG